MGQNVNSHDTQSVIPILSEHPQLVWFTTLSNTFLKSTTSTFLLILALGTSSLVVLGVFFVHPIALLPPLQRHNHSRIPLLNDDSMKNRHYTPTDTNTDGQSSNCAGAVHSIQASDQKTSTLNVHGKALLHNLDYYFMRMYAFLFPLTFYVKWTVAGTGRTCMSWIFLKYPLRAILPRFV